MSGPFRRGSSRPQLSRRHWLLLLRFLSLSLPFSSFVCARVSYALQYAVRGRVGVFLFLHFDKSPSRGGRCVCVCVCVCVTRVSDFMEQVPFDALIRGWTGFYPVFLCGSYFFVAFQEDCGDRLHAAIEQSHPFSSEGGRGGGGGGLTSRTTSEWRCLTSPVVDEESKKKTTTTKCSRVSQTAHRKR